MANCRGNCQAEMLIGEEPRSDFEPVKSEANRHDLTMKQPGEHWHVLRAERVKNLDRQCGFAESTRDGLPEGQRTSA
ncbi:TPA: hypothetical protein ACPJ1R_004396 [Vibrio alginolyticus]